MFVLPHALAPSYSLPRCALFYFVCHRALWSAAGDAVMIFLFLRCRGGGRLATESKRMSCLLYLAACTPLACLPVRVGLSKGARTAPRHKQTKPGNCLAGVLGGSNGRPRESGTGPRKPLRARRRIETHPSSFFCRAGVVPAHPSPISWSSLFPEQRKKTRQGRTNQITC